MTAAVKTQSQMRVSFRESISIRGRHNCMFDLSCATIGERPYFHSMQGMYSMLLVGIARRYV